MMAWFDPVDRLRVYLTASTTYDFPACDHAELNTLLTNWNKHCFAWTSGGSYEVGKQGMKHKVNQTKVPPPQVAYKRCTDACMHDLARPIN